MKKIEENLETLIEQFLLEKKASGLSSKSIKCYADALKKYSTSHESITADEVTAYKLELASEGLKLASINHNITHLRTFAYWLMERENIKSFRIKLVKGQQETIKTYTDDELTRLLTFDKNFNFAEHRTYVMIAFVLSTGARADTLLNLQMTDIDLKNREVTYTHLKNKKTAVIPLSAQLCNILNKYLNTWKRETENEFLFPDKDESQLSYNALRQSFNRYCERKKVESRGIHCLRHTMARNYILNGGNAFMLQQMLTHSTITMTQHYVHLFSADLKRDIDNLSPLDALMKKQGCMHK